MAVEVDGVVGAAEGEYQVAGIGGRQEHQDVLRRDTGAEDQAIDVAGTARVLDGVTTVAQGEVVGVRAEPAAQHVLPEASGQGVVADAGVEDLVERAPEENVVLAASGRDPGEDRAGGQLGSVREDEALDALVAAGLAVEQQGVPGPGDLHEDVAAAGLADDQILRPDARAEDHAIDVGGTAGVFRYLVVAVAQIEVVGVGSVAVRQDVVARTRVGLVRRTVPGAADDVVAAGRVLVLVGSMEVRLVPDRAVLEVEALDAFEVTGPDDED